MTPPDEAYRNQRVLFNSTPVPDFDLRADDPRNQSASADIDVGPITDGLEP